MPRLGLLGRRRGQAPIERLGRLGAPARPGAGAAPRATAGSRNDQHRRGLGPLTSGRPARRSPAGRPGRRRGAPRPGPGACPSGRRRPRTTREAARVAQCLELAPWSRNGSRTPSTSPGRARGWSSETDNQRVGTVAPGAARRPCPCRPRRVRRCTRSTPVRRCGRSSGGRGGPRAGCARDRGGGGSR